MSGDHLLHVCSHDLYISSTSDIVGRNYMLTFLGPKGISNTHGEQNLILLQCAELGSFHFFIRSPAKDGRIPTPQSFGGTLSRKNLKGSFFGCTFETNLAPLV